MKIEEHQSSLKARELLVIERGTKRYVQQESLAQITKKDVCPL
jgi:hypothetical protein